MIFKGHGLERSKSLGKRNGTIGFLDLKNINLVTKMVTLSALFQKLMSKTSFCIMVANVMHPRASHAQTTQYIFSFLEKKTTQATLHKKLVTIWVAGKRNMAQNVILQVVTLKGQGHPLRSKCFYHTPATYQ